MLAQQTVPYSLTLESLLMNCLKSSFLVRTGFEMTLSNSTATAGMNGAWSVLASHVSFVVFLKSLYSKGE